MTDWPIETMSRFFDFISRLDEVKIRHTLHRDRDDLMTVVAAVPGQRWQIDFFLDGRVQVEIFTSDGQIRGESELDRLFSEHGR